MKLYIRYRLLCAIWCAVETVFFGGIIYGWGSLVFVLKEEGFYNEECIGNILINNTEHTNLNITENTSSVQKNVSQGYYSVYSDFGDMHNSSPGLTSTRNTGKLFVTCPKQEARLNLWFSIAVAFMYSSMAFLGEMINRFGTQITRHIFTFTYVSGALCVAFATKDIPWLLCPGLCGIAVSGLVIFATNIQVANLFPRAQSTVVALYCGMFDSSSVIQELMKIANEHGVSRRTYYMCLAGLALVMLSISTILFLPRSYITKRNIRRKSCEIEDIKGLRETDETSLRTCLMSLTYVIHVGWMSIHTVTFVTFIGLINVNLERLSDSKHVGDIMTGATCGAGDAHSSGTPDLAFGFCEVSKYLGVFAYTTMCTVLAGVLAGTTYDCLRKRYYDYPAPARVWRAVLLPLTVTGILGSLVYILLLVNHLTVMVPIFILFTLYRSFLYSVGLAFVNDAFPEQHFGTLYGIMTFSTGLCSLLQYGFFSLFDVYGDAHTHVKLFLLFLCLLTFIHPIQLGIRSRSQKDTPTAETDVTFLQEVEGTDGGPCICQTT